MREEEEEATSAPSAELWIRGSVAASVLCAATLSLFFPSRVAARKAARAAAALLHHCRLLRSNLGLFVGTRVAPTRETRTRGYATPTCVSFMRVFSRKSGGGGRGEWVDRRGRES